MANLTAGAKLKVKSSSDIKLNAALSAIKVWWGAMIVMAQGVGYAAKPSNAAGERFLGFCSDSVVDNSGGAAGDLRVNVIQPDFFSPIAWSVVPTVVDIGKRYYFQDDQTVGLTVTANYAGTLAYIDKAGDGYVDARRAYGAPEGTNLPGAAPTTPVEGSVYFKAADKKFYVYSGGGWVSSAALA